MIKDKVLEILCSGEIQQKGNAGFLCKGSTSEGIEINIKITLDGIVESAYPIIRG